MEQATNFEEPIFALVVGARGALIAAVSDHLYVMRDGSWQRVLQPRVGSLATSNGGETVFAGTIFELREGRLSLLLRGSW